MFSQLVRLIKQMIHGGSVRNISALGAETGEESFGRLLGRELDLVFDTTMPSSKIETIGHHLFSGLRKRDFPVLEDKIKFFSINNYNWERSSILVHLTPKNLDLFQHWLLIGLASFHSNGYVRQAAVEKIKPCDGEWLGFLLLRVNDWVPQIRKASEQKLLGYMRPEYGQAWVENLPLITRLSKCHRVDRNRFPHEFTGFLQNECQEALAHGCRHEDRDVSRACYRLAFESGSQFDPQLIQEGLKSDDGLIRLWAANHATASGHANQAFLAKISQDPLMSVRRVYFYHALKNNEKPPIDFFTPFLLDKHREIRNLARFYLKKGFPDFDFSSFYLSRLKCSGGREKISCIFGLSETGDKNHIPVIASYTDKGFPSTRKAALKALIDLGATQYDALFIKALIGPSAGLSATGRRAFQAGCVFLSPKSLWDLWSPDLPDYVGKNILLIVAHKGKWPALPILLEACMTKNIAIAPIAREMTERWRSHFNLWYGDPEPQDAEALRKVVAANPEIYVRFKYITDILQQYSIIEAAP